MKLRLLVDVDNVIANFGGLYVACCNAANGTTFDVSMLARAGRSYGKALGLNHNQQRKTWRLIEQEGVAAHMQPLPGLEYVKRFTELYDVYFVSAGVPCSTWAHDRRTWLRQYFGDEVQIVSTPHKSIVSGHMLIDDRLDVVTAWCEQQAMCSKLPYVGVVFADVVAPSRSDVVVTQDWETITKLLETAQKLVDGGICT